MPRARQTKLDKARYDRERKVFERKERRFTKPLKLFMQRKYPAQYNEFVKFFNLMEKTSGKKDLTKTEMFKKFLNDHPAQETEVYPVIASLLEPTTSPIEVASQPFPNTSPTEAASQPFPNTSPTEAASQPFPNTSPTEAASQPFPNTSSTSLPSSTSTQIIEPSSSSSQRDIISELVDELFGQGDLDQYIEHVENVDEGIDVNIFDEMKLDWEPFDFELETVNF